MSNDRPLRVLIVGAGIAGPALALWLQRLGHSCTVIERWEALRLGGQQIDIRRQGIEAVKRMGILDDIRDRVVDEAGFDFVNEKNQSILFFPRHEPGSKTQSFSSEFEIMRGDLCRIMYEKTKEKVTYRFGLSVDSFENVGDVVKVKLSDGSLEEYDMLVGADGQGSRIRRAINKDVGGDEQFLRSTGAFVAYYAIKRNAEDQDHASGIIGTQKRFVLTRWHSPDLGQVYLMTHGHADVIKAALKEDAPKQKAVFADIFKTLRWNQIDRVIDAMDTTDDFYAHEVLQVRNKNWSTGRVVLLGDAGFCPSVMTGMGTTLALVGAYVLAGEIAKSKGDLNAAFTGYDATLRPYIDKWQVLSNTFGWIQPKTYVGLRVTNFVLWVAGKLGFPKLIEKWALKDEKEDWVMPRYEELHAGEEPV